MKSAARFALITVLTLGTLGTLGAQTVPSGTKPDDPPAKLVLPTGPEKDALQTAIHHQDQAAKEVADLTTRLQQLQTQAQNEFQRLSAKQAAADKAVEDARTSALKSLKLDPVKYALDYETWEATPKPEPKPAAENPVKK